ncbi:MAG: hypothetical protein ACE5EG_00850 [Thermoanaerobaculia bacterium]
MPLCYHLPIPPSATPARGDDLAFKLPKIQLGPKPKKWDLLALAVLVLAVVLAAISWRAARAQLPGVSPSSSFTSLVAFAQLAIGSLSLLLLGKTAKDGTLWGNLAAIGGMFAGLSGVLLAAALWVAA